MNSTRLILAVFLTSFAPLALAQNDSCESLILRDGIVSLPMQTSGQAAVAVLNTGVLPIGISRTLAQNIGREVEPIPSRNIVWSSIPVITGQVSDVPVRIFGQDLQIEQMYVMENPLPFVYMSLFMFNDFIVQLNIPKSQLCFLNRKALNMRDAANIEVKDSAGKIAVQVSINKSKPVWLELQLEYNGAIRLNRDAVQELGLDIAADTEKTSIDSLMFGPYELGNIAVDLPPASLAGGADLQRLGRRGGGGVKTSGVLGFEILKHFVVTLDAKGEKMHVIVP